MRMHSLAALALLAPALTAQTILDDFAYPDGPVVPNWTPQRGAWQVRGGRLAVTTGNTWAYITRDGIVAADSVLEAQFLVVRRGIQFGGLAARHPGGDIDDNLLIAKVQNNGADAFDRIYAYERGQALGTYFRDLVSPTANVRARMITLDAEMWLECDTDQDGLFDLVLPRRPLVSVFGARLLGLAAFAASQFAATQIDSFRYFDSVLVPRPLSTPRIGTTYSLVLDTPTANVPWLGLLSLGKAGIPLGTRAVPLTLDDLLIAAPMAAAAAGLWYARKCSAPALPR
jgi:hypothetical protein